MMQKGFSLLEILIVAAIIALLAGGGLYLKYAEQSQSAAQAGVGAIQQARQVQQQVDAQTLQEQSSTNAASK